MAIVLCLCVRSAGEHELLVYSSHVWVYMQHNETINFSISYSIQSFNKQQLHCIQDLFIAIFLFIFY